MDVCGNEFADSLAREGRHKDSARDGLLLFQKFLAGSSKTSVPPGGESPYMSGTKETVLVLLCLRQAVGEMKLLLLGFAVDILELNGMWRVLKFTLLVLITM
ncbi:hypothetical protein TNCV_4162061 [Trichonephila clavipes]|nr:hypothetical protein TNCV_4162061 [Trichonephila clavipes]